MWLTAWLLLALPLFALVACTDEVSQDEQSQTQRQQEQIQEQDDPSQEPAASESDAEEEQPQDVQTTGTPDQQQEDQPRSSAADAMQRDQQKSQQQTQSYGAADPYGEEDDGQDDQPITPVPPVRQWLAEGVALEPSVPAESDEYGWSAVIEGDVIAVGAPYHDELGEDTGAVFIFERIDGEWIETAYLLPPFPDPLGWFGRWLAIDNGRIVIGAPYEDGLREDGSRIDDSGVAYVYENVNGEWTRTGTLLPQTPNSGASFGWSVAISGERIAVSAWEDPLFGMQTGSVTIFTQHKGLWRAEAVLQPAEASERMMFGRDIELQGNVLAVGAPGDDTIAEDAGAVYVWHYYGEEWNFAGKLVAADGIAHDRLGSQVALHQPWLAAGAYDHDDPFWSAGATYVWKLDNLWDFHAKLEASDMQPGDWFGYSVDIQGDFMVIGAPHRAHPETGTYRSGAAYAFELTDDQWLEVGVLGPVDAVEAGERAEFGWVTEIHETTAVVGAWLADTDAGGLDAGSAAVYELPTNDEDGGQNGGSADE
ncbi:MAG: hypothetical protein OXI41_04895 [Chloroflexota bacterium]|nr:hypothetical protein [Chloroflexota bacterium]MDE2894974.1 hypothetical protein [Chloroflexota bacterium]